MTTKQAELKVAELNLAAEKATAEGEKATLLEQKATAEAEAKAAAEAEAAYKARQTSPTTISCCFWKYKSFRSSASNITSTSTQHASDYEDSSYLQHLHLLQLLLDNVQHTVQMLQVIQLVNVLGELKH